MKQPHKAQNQEGLFFTTMLCTLLMTWPNVFHNPVLVKGRCLFSAGVQHSCRAAAVDKLQALSWHTAGPFTHSDLQPQPAGGTAQKHAQPHLLAARCRLADAEVELLQLAEDDQAPLAVAIEGLQQFLQVLTCCPACVQAVGSPVCCALQVGLCTRRTGQDGPRVLLQQGKRKLCAHLEQPEAA